jgi:multidrug efflux pump subunit AcrA (membrane-fusion protein)
VVASHADGVIVEMAFQYGEFVKEGRILFKISSTKFLSDYKSALLQYVKAKNEFNSSQTQLAESQFLHHHQLISDDEYKTKKSNYYINQLALLQAKDVLENLIHQLDIKDINLYQLTISDIDKITEAMHLKRNAEHLRIVSPITGVVLSPIKNDEESKKIIKGDIIKEGDVLAVIGDMSGLMIKIKVNELIVNQLKIGQKVKVTGIAFPDELLLGNILRIDKQGESINGGLPVFSVQIIVPYLTPSQQNTIHVGMSAKIEIDIEEKPIILIPITAVKMINGQTFVTMYEAMHKTIYNNNNGINKVNKINKKYINLKKISVKTGKTTVENVEIISGLYQGDLIVVPN